MRIFKQYLRYLRKDLWISVPRLLSLVISISIIMLLFLFVIKELQTDRFNKQLDRIYRIEIEGDPSLPSILAETAIQNIPEIIHYCRINYLDRQLLKTDERNLHSEALFVDSAFFDIFSYKLILGNPENALKGQNSIVLTEDESRRCFGKSNPVGRKILLNNEVFVTVCGVYQKPLKKSSIPYLNLISYNTLGSSSYDTDYKGPLSSWSNWSVDEIVLLINKHATAENIEKSIFRNTPWINNPESNVSLRIKPYSDYYFKSPEARGNLRNVFIIISAAVLVILFSISNHIYHSLFYPVSEPLNIGIKKTFGNSNSGTWYEIFQYCILDYLIAASMSLVFIRLLYFRIEPIYDLNLDYRTLTSPVFLLILLSLGILQSTIISASIVLKKANNDAGCLLKNNSNRSIIPPLTRKMFLSSQYLITLVCVIVLLGANRQTRFSLKSIPIKNPGLISIDLSGMDINRRMVLKEILLDMPETKNVYLSSFSPGERIRKNGGVLVSSEGINKKVNFRVFNGSYDYINIYRTRLIEGRYFSSSTSDINGALVNQEFISKNGLKKALGTTLTYSSGDIREVIGVLEDFNYEKTDQKIAPLVIYNNEATSGKYGYYCIIEPAKGDTGDLILTRNKIEDAMKYHYPDFPSKINMVSDKIMEAHKNEIDFRNISALFFAGTILILIAGTVSITQLICRQREKEISIRKINGAGIRDVIQLIIKDFLVQFIISFTISVPVSLIILARWMEQFEYRAKLSIWIFAGSGLSVLIISLILIYLRTVSTAKANPADKIRYHN